ncbi:MAG: hypothetical protein QXR64_03535 [Pyrobaculum sp.]
MFIALTSFTKSGVESCVDFLESIKARTVWLPLPVELCRGEFIDMGPFEKYLEPLVALYHMYRERWRCYESFENLRKKTWAAVDLAALVIKARAYGKIELSKWDALFKTVRRRPLPRPALAFGALLEEDGVVCGVYPPNPVETAWEIWSRLTHRYKLELARWVVDYVSYVVESEELDDAYLKIIERGWDSVFRKLLSHL